MDSGRCRRRRRRRTHLRVDRDSSGPLDRSDRRPWQFRHCHGGAWRRRPDILLGACGPGRRDRTGRAGLVGGVRSHPPAISKRQIVDGPDVVLAAYITRCRTTGSRLPTLSRAGLSHPPQVFLSLALSRMSDESRQRLQGRLRGLKVSGSPQAVKILTAASCCIRKSMLQSSPWRKRSRDGAREAFERGLRTE
jgi:hypothetical protein